ncbi:MAG: AraC family transcriptional regulator [Prolixibacteraceae bacterium]|jgi:YesN/AraC family two-component response regulator
MKLYIKNMVCTRCETTVKSALDRIGIQYDTVKIGEVGLVKRITSEQQIQLSAALLQDGFELIDDQKNELIEKLKKSIIDLEQYSDEDLKTSFSDYISLIVDDNFISLNKLFAEIEGITIEKYIIKRKIERIKEMLVYEDLNLDQIALKMHYSNTTSLSYQFKHETGLTPSHFKNLRVPRNIIPELN